jgi:iron(III) transport system permease protein
MHHEQGWFSWRLITLILGALFILFPVALPFIELLRSPSAWKVWVEWDRMAELAGNTLFVAAGSSLLAILLGGVSALLLVRTRLVGRWVWGLLLGVGLFIPLPMLLSGWYLIAQSFGATMPALWPPEARLLGTIIIYGFMGVPWAALVLSLGLLWIEPELEEEMLLYSSFAAVLRRIILPRCWPFLGMAVLMVCWPTWHEITVTDFFKVRTIAEEVYLQLNDGSLDEGPRAVAAVLPWCLLMMMASFFMMQRWRKQCPQSWPSNARQQRYVLGNWQVAAQLWMLLVFSLLVLIPCCGLIVRAGMDYTGGASHVWSSSFLGRRVSAVIVNQSGMLLQSLSMAAITGIITSFSVMIFLWLARGSRRLESLFWWCAALLWSIPGPLLGLGLLSVIQLLIQAPGGSFWSVWLYSEPSPVPNIWSGILRFLPLAWLALWPIARTLPKEWDEAAWLEGASPWRRFWVLFFPSLIRPTWGMALGVGLLALGEISASKLVTTPGYLPLSQNLFQQLHAGADSEVAALSLTLLLPALLSALGVGIVLGVHRLRQDRQGQQIR